MMARDSQNWHIDVLPETTYLRDAIFKLRETRTTAHSQDPGTEVSKTSEIWDIIGRVIDETILPREFALCVDGAERVRLSVYNCQLVSVQPLPGCHVTFDPSPSAAHDLAACLRAVCDTGHAFMLKKTGRGIAIEDAGAFCSGQQLRDALHGRSPVLSNSDPLGTLKSMAKALIQMDPNGNEQESFGPDRLLQALRTVHAMHESEPPRTRTRRVTRAHQSQPTCLIVPYNDHLKLAIANLGDLRVVFFAARARFSSASFLGIFERNPEPT